MRWILWLIIVLGALLLLSNCISSGLTDTTVLQVHLDDSLSVQAGKYDYIRIDLVDKDGKVLKESVFSGPYDREKDKATLENIQIGQGAPNPITIVISAYKGNEKQAEYRFKVSGRQAIVEPSSFVPPVKIPADTGKPEDTASTPAKIILSPRSLTLYEGGDSALLTVAKSGVDSGKEIRFRSSNEEVVVTSAAGGLFPLKAGNAMIIAFLVASPNTADTAMVTVKKDVPVIDAGPDRKVPLDSAVTFHIKVTQEYGSVKILKWDLDGNGSFEDSAAKAEIEVKQTYRSKGDITARIFARDSEGNETIKPIRVQAGILTPFVVITSPASDTLVNVPSLKIEYTTDGIQKSKIASLLEGKNVVPVQETNTYGSGGDTVVVTLDTHAPGKPGFSAQLPAASNNRRPTWTWTANPTDKGIGIFKIRLDSKDVKEGSLLTFKPESDLIDGAHLLEVQERDSAGNWSELASHTIYVDGINPDVKIESPTIAKRFSTAGTEIIISGSVTDVGGLASVKYLWGASQAVAEGGEKWKTASISLAENSSTTIIVQAIDKAGNAGADTLIVYCDRKGPDITITSPSEIGNLFTTSSKQNVKGIATDTSSIKFVTYLLSGATNYEDDATGLKDWNIPEITLRPGSTRLMVTAYDSLMNSSKILLDFNYKANILLVNSAATGANSGTTWKDAYQDLQTALSRSLTGEIWVAKGTYKPTTGQERTATFRMQEGMHILGGFKGGETAKEDRATAANLTILSGDIGGSVASDNVYHVVTGANHASLDGFTIVGGYADGPSDEDSSRGGAIFAGGTSPNIINCIIKNNYALDGAGMYMNNAFSQVTNCIFMDNKSRDNAGAIRITGNSTPLIVNSLFVRNNCGTWGGAIFNGDNVLGIKNSIFSGNTASYGKNVASSGIVTIYNSNVDETYEGGLLAANGTGEFNLFGKKGPWIPQFQGTNDFRLKPGSPGIDEGVNDQDIPRFDITGAERPKGNGMDIGPYEQ